MRYLILLTLFLSTSLIAGSFQKWVDEDGNVHYGDAPPTSAKTESVHVQPAPTNPGKSLPRLSTSDEKKTTASTDESLPGDQAKIACDTAKEDLEIMNNSTRVKIREADGSTRYMSAEEIEERKALAEEEIAKFC